MRRFVYAAAALMMLPERHSHRLVVGVANVRAEREVPELTELVAGNRQPPTTRPPQPLRAPNRAIATCPAVPRARATARPNLVKIPVDPLLRGTARLGRRCLGGIP
jgi:hypothetical protein